MTEAEQGDADGGARTVGGMELLLVRHGQPAWVSPDGLGDNDPGLTPLGRRQALQAAARLASLDVDELLASPAARARATVAPIADALQQPVTFDEGLWEIRPPDAWEGAPTKVVAETFREWRPRSRADWWEQGPHGEPFREFHVRITTTLERLLAERGVVRTASDPDLWEVAHDDDRRFVVVAHNGTNSLVLGTLLGISPQPWEWERFNSNHASITTLRTTRISDAAIWTLQHFSAVDHLDEPTA